MSLTNSVADAKFRQGTMCDRGHERTHPKKKNSFLHFTCQIISLENAFCSLSARVHFTNSFFAIKWSLLISLSFPFVCSKCLATPFDALHARKMRLGCAEPARQPATVRKEDTICVLQVRKRLLCVCMCALSSIALCSFL